MMRNLFSYEGEVFLCSPRHGAVLDLVVVDGCVVVVRQVPVAVKGFAQDGVVGFLGDRALATGVVGREVPPKHLYHSFPRTVHFRYPTRKENTVGNHKLVIVQVFPNNARYTFGTNMSQMNTRRPCLF